MKVLVLGGRGFIGRHVVTALRARDATVVVGSRRPPDRSGRASRRVRLEQLLDAKSWEPHVVGVDVVVNCVGILRERLGESYDAIHRVAPGALASACARKGIRLVHVSALGLPGSRHPFMTSKLAGERAILAAHRDCVIVRPSLLDGSGGYGARWMRALARLPIHFVPSQATGHIAAMDVGELGEAIAALCDARDDFARVVELGGPRALPFADYLQALRALDHDRPALTIRLPAAWARAAARVCDTLHWSPYSAGHLELLTRDNVPTRNALAGLLGRAPAMVGACAHPRAAADEPVDRHRRLTSTTPPSLNNTSTSASAGNRSMRVSPSSPGPGVPIGVTRSR